MIEVESLSKDYGPPRPKALCALWSEATLPSGALTSRLAKTKRL